jgi:hypothetical protein
MKYENPSVVLVGSASELVQGIQSKPAPTLSDNFNDDRASDGSAYQADE